MPNLQTPPPARVPLATVEVAGKPVSLYLTPEWARYFESLNTQVVTTSGIVYQLGAAAAGGGMMLGEGSGEDGMFIPVVGEQGRQGDSGPALYLNEDSQAFEFVPGPKGDQGIQGPAGPAVGLLWGEGEGSQEMFAPQTGQGTSITGDVTAAASTGPLVATVTKINGTSLAGLATGIVKNTTATGAPSIAVAADFPTLNQNTTGSAATWTTARNLAGNSVNGSANVPFANKFIVQGTADTGLSAAQFLGALGTGIVKNTTTTGVLSIAVAGDFPTLNQNTTGTASNVTGTVAVANGGTGDTGTAWTSYTPTITANSGTLTTVSAAGAYKQIGKTLILRLQITITTNGTAAVSLNAPLPAGMTSIASRQVLAGRADAVSGKMLQGIVPVSSTAMIIRNYDNTYPGANSEVLAMSGVIELA